ncbi:MFS transporter [Ktedonobacter robiniae]|uniref:MFS transporter n=2 Tax=Ktedonobacter robiniae TaxID=2778365 RepID=A0ABQ3ULW3_9CHLR|nr:MFS transporter [Ktedonobacter robiniae]
MQAFSASMDIVTRASLPVSITLAIAALLTYWPWAVFPLFGGILSDHFERRTIVRGAQVLLSLQSLLLACFHTEAAVLYIMGTTGGIIGALSNPAQLGLLRDLADEKYAQANAKISVYNQAGQIIGVTVGSLLFFQANLAEVAYIADAASYLPVIVVLGLLPKTMLTSMPTVAECTQTRPTLKEARTFLWQDATLKQVLILRLILAFGASGGYVAQRLLASDVFGGLKTYTWFTVINSAGVLIGSSIAARLFRKQQPSVRGVLTGAIGSLLLTVATGLSHSLPLTLAILLGGCIAYLYSSEHSTPLLVVKDGRLRERVAGLMQATTMICTIMCNLLIGLLTLVIGVLSTEIVLGASCLLIMGLYKARVRLREKSLT